MQFFHQYGDDEAVKNASYKRLRKADQTNRNSKQGKNETLRENKKTYT
jgi:hypothetical protein